MFSFQMLIHDISLSTYYYERKNIIRLNYFFLKDQNRLLLPGRSRVMTGNRAPTTTTRLPHFLRTLVRTNSYHFNFLLKFRFLLATYPSNPNISQFTSNYCNLNFSKFNFLILIQTLIEINSNPYSLTTHIKF